MNGKATCKVFVYGSLREGFGNHDLIKGSNFMGDAKTLPEFTMLGLGGFPGLVHSGETIIVGELYEVDMATLADLDRLEGHPDFYQRAPFSVEDSNGIFHEAFIYVLPTVWMDGGSLIIQSGDWAQRP